jgi:hypothetical protein
VYFFSAAQRENKKRKEKNSPAEAQRRGVGKREPEIFF